MAKPSKAAKADALLVGGHVHPYRIAPEGMRGIRAHVDGDSGCYDSAAWYDARGRVHYACTCEYAEVHPVKQDCSHAMAVAKLI